MIGFYSYTVILTYLSLAISVFGMVQALNGHYATALLCLLASGVCDMFDGKVARSKKDRTEDEKRFGIQIDSLCDLVCFGVFPAVIGYSLGIRSHLGKIYLVLFVLAAVVRLAYFNVTEETRQQTTDENRKYYQGLPGDQCGDYYSYDFFAAPLFFCRVYSDLRNCPVMYRVPFYSGY